MTDRDAETNFVVFQLHSDNLFGNFQKESKWLYLMLERFWILNILRIKVVYTYWDIISQALKFFRR